MRVRAQEETACCAWGPALAHGGFMLENGSESGVPSCPGPPGWFVPSGDEGTLASPARSPGVGGQCLPPAPSPPGRSGPANAPAGAGPGDHGHAESIPPGKPSKRDKVLTGSRWGRIRALQVTDGKLVGAIILLKARV
jgi:hypothetical protein